MTTLRKRVPVRITLWPDDNTRIDVRAWLDEFDSYRDHPDFDVRYPDKMLQHDYTLRAHNNWLDAPWKFKRGKPER